MTDPLPLVTDPPRFTAALIAYFGDGTRPGYYPGSEINGSSRILEQFPGDGPALAAQVNQMLDAAYDWKGPLLPLDDKLQRIRTQLSTHYPFLPAFLQEKVVQCCAYSLSR